MTIEVTFRKYAVGTKTGIEIVPAVVGKMIPGKGLTEEAIANLEVGLDDLIKEAGEALGEEVREMTAEEIAEYKDSEEQAKANAAGMAVVDVTAQVLKD